MIQIQKIANAVRVYFQRKTKAQHTVNILSGPKRETWFSAEMFVAISALQPKGSKRKTSRSVKFAVYGEQSLSTLDKRLTGLKRPDIVVFDPSKLQGSPKDPAVSTLIEVKLFRTNENNIKEINTLASQLESAANTITTATVAGVVFVASVPVRTPGLHQRAVDEIRQAMEQALPDADYEWVDGHDLAELIPLMPTSFAYPDTNVAINMGVRVRRAQTTSPAP